MSKAAQFPSPKQCQQVSGILKTLGHPQRLMILCQLSDGKKSVSQLEELTGAGQSQISQFLNRMKLEGLIKSERDSQFVLYSIADPQITKLIQALQKIYC